MGAWFGVDLDRTLAMYGSAQGIKSIGKPIAPMVDRVKTWLAEGTEVRIVTARVADPVYVEEQTKMIEEWCLLHLGQVLPVTASKDFEMVELWDDRAVAVLPNLGVPLDETDFLVAIESDAYVTMEKGKDEVTVHMVTGNPNDSYTMGKREAMVLASRLLRAIRE